MSPSRRFTSAPRGCPPRTEKSAHRRQYTQYPTTVRLLAIRRSSRARHACVSRVSASNDAKSSHQMIDAVRMLILNFELPRPAG
jgi:hypothetical protein